MHKSNLSIQSFGCYNRFSSEAGALVQIDSDFPPLQPHNVWAWVQSLPCTFRITEAELQGVFFDVFVSLLMALTEQARLDKQASARLIQCSDDLLLLWLPLDDPRACWPKVLNRWDQKRQK